MPFPSVLPSPRVPDPRRTPVLRWAVAGPGWIAERFVQSLEADTNQRIVAVNSRSLERARAFAARWDISKRPMATSPNSSPIRRSMSSMSRRRTITTFLLPWLPSRVKRCARRLSRIASCWLRRFGQLSCPSSTCCAKCSLTGFSARSTPWQRAVAQAWVPGSRGLSHGDGPASGRHGRGAVTDSELRSGGAGDLRDVAAVDTDIGELRVT